MNMRIITASVALAFMASAGAHASTPKEAKRTPPKAEKPQQDQRDEQPKTLDKAKPDRQPGEGFLIRGREGSVMDKGRTDTQPTWDLWRK